MRTLSSFSGFIEMEQRVCIEDLRHGMFVCALDRPWLGTPFPIEGFLIESDTEIHLLRKLCEYVYVLSEDEGARHHKSKKDVPSNGGRPFHAIGATPANRGVSETSSPTTGSFAQGNATYLDTRPIEKEIDTARELHAEVTKAVEEILHNVRDGKKLDVDLAKAAVARMSDSILRNPDAFMWLRLLKNKDSYTFTHCMDSSALAIAFGRHMGLSREQIDNLGMGALMADIGKMSLPDDLLNKTDKLTNCEMEMVRGHVHESVRVMEELEGISPEAVQIAASHHERFDGSGYPQGLRADSIPVLARMVGIVDCYDAITSNRAYQRHISAHEAIRRLYEWRGSLFQAELVELFIETLGVYPTGTVVELTTGQVGIVIAQNRSRRLRPKVMLVLDTQKSPYGAAPIVDLLHETEDRMGKPLEVFRVLEPGSYGIDPQHFYL